MREILWEKEIKNQRGEKFSEGLSVNADQEKQNPLHLCLP
jgi:hypothetical protein